MNVDRSKFVLGGVPYIDIDGIDYPISSDGCVIEKVADIGITNVVGKPEPRIVERVSHYTVTVSMLENTLEMLGIAWNLPNAVSYGTTSDYLYLGISSAPTARTLAVRGWGGLGGSAGTRRWREYYFRKVVSYEPQPQDLGVGNTVFIPVRFYCYADSTQADGQEFGYIQQQKMEFIINGRMESNSDWVGQSAPVTCEQSSAQAHGDAYSWHVVTDATGEGVKSETLFTTVAGKSYRVTGWVYLASLTATNVLLTFRSGDGATWTTIGTVTTIGSWVKLESTVTNDAGGASGLVLIRQNGAGGANYYVDDVSVKEI